MWNNYTISKNDISRFSYFWSNKCYTENNNLVRLGFINIQRFSELSPLWKDSNLLRNFTIAINMTLLKYLYFSLDKVCIPSSLKKI